MANKYLRRLLRSSGLFIFTSIASHEAAPHATSTYRLKHKPLQGLPANNNCPLLQGRAAARSLSLQLASRLPSSAPYNSSAHEGKCVSTNHKKEADQQQLACSHSYSRLQGKQQLITSFKSLLHQPSSNNHQLHVDRHSLQTLSQSRSQSKLEGKRAAKGHVAVYVEEGRERHVLPIAYLSQPHFQALLKQAEREFGYKQQGPGLRLPCSLSELNYTLHQIRSL